MKNDVPIQEYFSLPYALILWKKWYFMRTGALYNLFALLYDGGKCRKRGNKDMEIRGLGPEDAEVFSAIRLESLEQEPEAFGASLGEERKRTLEGWKERLTFSPTHENGYYGAFSGGELAGIIGYFRHKGAKVRHKAEIVSMYVKASHRGTGMAAGLMQAALSHLRSIQEIDQVQLAVVSSNHAAARFYEKMGFQPYGFEKRALKIGERYVDETHLYLLMENESEGM